jgi:Fe-S oxidoreductase
MTIGNQAVTQVGANKSGGASNQVSMHLQIPNCNQHIGDHGYMPESIWLGRALFAVLLATSFGLFASRLRPIAANVWRSKPGGGFQIAPTGRRIGKFLWEVLLQAKVIQQRPLPGFAHALVFWGFCAFGLVTLDHFARGCGGWLIDPAGFFGRFYFGLAALFAVAVIVSIGGLAARRFLVRPKWLGEKVSIESGVIAFLIFTLMWTYLADYLSPGHLELPARIGWVWWTHTLALLTFLPLIPHTKHLHLVLSPLTVFLARDGFSEIPKLEGDEDFGLVTGKDLTRIVSLQAYSCVECGRCTEHCPAHNTGKTLNPKQIVLGVRSYLNEFGPESEQTLLGKHNSLEAVFQCTTCGACEFQCPVGIQHLPVIVGLRRGAVNTGNWDDGYGNKLFLNLERNGNPLGMAASEREKFVTKLDLPLYDGTQDYCLWLGCMGSYDPKGREIIGALVDVMRHLKVTFGVLKKERCTGDSARRLGNDLAFGQLAEQNLETIRAAAPKKMISICPHCVRTMTEDWKEFGETPAVEHHSVFLARHQHLLPKAPANGTVVYHDPCYLGRYQDIYEEPRQVAALGGPVADPPRARERSFCCGAGGGLAFLGEEHGDRVSETRARELVATGAGTVAAACPFCNTMFRDALVQVSNGQPAPQLLDIAQIAAARIPTAAPPA